MEKKQRKPIVSYLISSGTILIVSLIFSLMGLIFLSDKIPPWVQVLLGFVFMAPVGFLAFTIGKSSGEAMYKNCAKNTLKDINKPVAVTIPIYKCVYHVIAFAVPLIILAIITTITRNTVVHFIMALFLMPITLIFSSINVINVLNLNWVVCVTYVPYILIIAGLFVLGYFFRIKKLKRQQMQIEGELRMFNN